jgi:hypothetical protein
MYWLFHAALKRSEIDCNRVATDNVRVPGDRNHWFQAIAITAPGHRNHPFQRIVITVPDDRDP